MSITRRVLKVNSSQPYRNINGKYNCIPLINLQGRWLEKLGFTAGCMVEVKGKDGLMVIKVLKQD